MGVLVLFLSRTAPVTGVPAAPGVPELTTRVANVSGWPWLSVWLKLSHQAQSPALLPTEALVCQAWKVAFVLYSSNFCVTIPAAPGVYTLSLHDALRDLLRSPGSES